MSSMIGINALYLSPSVLRQMNAAFNQSKPSVLFLNDFLTQESYNLLFSLLEKNKGSNVYVPHQYRYDELTLPKNLLFSSRDFFEFIRGISNIGAKKLSLSARKFKHRDFTLLHDDLESNERLVFIYTLTKKWNSSFGGQTFFSFGDTRSPLIFEAQNNSLALIRVPKGMREFTKYVNHSAGKSEMIKIEGSFD